MVDNLADLEAQLTREIDQPPDTSITHTQMLAIRHALRRQFVEQFQAHVLAARLARKVGNEAHAQLNEGEARRILQMIAELDKEEQEDQKQITRLREDGQ